MGLSDLWRMVVSERDLLILDMRIFISRLECGMWAGFIVGLCANSTFGHILGLILMVTAWVFLFATNKELKKLESLQ